YSLRRSLAPGADIGRGRQGTPGNQFPGGHRRGVTPVPIPNTEVKLSTADGTAWETAWESRSLPGLFTIERPVAIATGLFLCRPCSVPVAGVQAAIMDLADHADRLLPHPSR